MIRMKVNLLVLFFTCSLFFSCQKTVLLRTAKGVVVDATTNEPIPFAQISVYRETSEFLGPTHRELEASVFSDEKGEFEIKFHKTNQGANRIYAKKENYDEIRGLSDDDVKEPGGRKSLELKLQPIAKLRLVYKKNSSYLFVECKSFLNGKGAYYKTLVNENEEDTVEVQGNQITTFLITKEKQGQTRDVYEEGVFCESNKVTTYIINY